MRTPILRAPVLIAAAGAVVAITIATLQPVRASVPVGVVNLQQLLSSYPEYRSADQQVKNAEANYQKALADRMKKLQEAAAKGKSQAELQKMQKQFEAELKPIQTRGISLYKSLQEKLKGKIITAINQVAKAKGVEVVYDKSAVLYGGQDLTAAVSQKLH